MPPLSLVAHLSRQRFAWAALALSLAVHVWLLAEPGEPRPMPTHASPALQLLPPVPAPVAAPVADPSPVHRLERAPAVERQALPKPAASPPVPLEATPSQALLRLSGPAEWHYRLRQAGHDGEAVLQWQPQPDGHYSLRLTRRIGDRSLPAWESLGRFGSTGLLPERFATQVRGQDRQAVNFDNDLGRVSFSASPAQLELPDGAQDRLSWWVQLAAMVQAQAAPPPGGRWRMWVAGVRGEVREWAFELAEADPEAPTWLALRRLPLGPEDPGLAVWLDPARGFWPARLRQGDPERRGFEIRLAEPVGGEQVP